MNTHPILVLTALSIGACKSEKETTTQPRPAPAATLAPVPTTAPQIPVTSGLPVTELVAPAAWETGTLDATASDDRLASAIERLIIQASTFEVLPQGLEGITLSALESKAEGCARNHLEHLHFQTANGQFAVSSPAAGQDFKACVETPSAPATGEASWSFAHGLDVRCSNTDFPSYDGQSLTAVKNTLCVEAPRGDLRFNTKFTANEGTKRYVHLRALQSSSGGACTFTTENDVRSWQDCQWIDKAERTGKGLRFTSIRFNGSKAQVQPTGLRFTEGRLDVAIDALQGEILFTSGRAQWTLRDAQGVTRTGTMDIPENVDSSTLGGPVLTGSFGEGKNISCTQTFDEFVASGTRHVSDGGTTHFFAGYRQASSTNKNPVVVRFDGANRTWCREDYEVTGDDGVAYGLAWNGSDRLYAVFSATGTQGTADQDYRRFTSAGWIASYGSGGGAKAAILLKLDPADGDATAGTFLRAQKGDGTTNSIQVTGISLAGDGVQVLANSWYSPLKTTKAPFACSGASPFAYTLTLSADLRTATTASADGCQ